MEVEKRKTVKELSLDFSILLIEYELKASSRRSVINSSQLIRSGTAIGAMIREAQGAESRKDLIHKMKIASKEAEETEYWLILAAKASPMPEIEQLQILIIRIQKMLSKIISTSIGRNHLPK